MRCTRLSANTGRKKSPSRYHRTILSGHIFATKAYIDNRKKLLSSNISSTCPDNMVNFHPLTAEVESEFGHPCKFHRLSRLGSVTARHIVVGVSQTLRHWTEGATYVRQGDHQVGHWPTFLVWIIIYMLCLVCQDSNDTNGWYDTKQQQSKM